ncbi:hypothetical protein H4S04_008697 [Coemansia sp. S16]|nr:hypothetical protein H4S04_008697 [Coemansia sp. S16]KAJ2038692.1 hypothetical protein H4S03_002182 [Coemansia sp. S3946]KAJ2046388.1 hypothetical protein GGI08_006544 [Coemansia sp. S2]KAJ2341880.1 hypothetical protein GGH92_005616 [Coemansia sp. RSA 2673]
MFGGILSTLRTTVQRLAPAANTLLPTLGGPQTQAIRGMAKLKTHKGTAKRWKAIDKGLYQRRQTGLRHKNLRLRSDIRRGKHAPVVCTEGQKWHLDRLLPY